MKVAAPTPLKTAHLLGLERLLASTSAGHRHDALEQTKEMVSHYR